MSRAYSSAVTFLDATPAAASHLPVTPRALETPAESQPIRTETRHGVLYVVDRLGASPVASPEIAASYARALRGVGIT